MEVVAATPGSGGVPPFHDHDVREWSRIDSITGALERARLETDHWSANTMNSTHKYGKVVDSRARSDADGALQQQARRQLEVFQSQIPGGHLQVIKTHTVSSSRWTNKAPQSTTTIADGFGGRDFENLQLPLNPLDLSSQKSKASVGRSATRRPPTRQRPKEDSPAHSDSRNSLRNAHLTATTNLHRVSRLCHQIHETAVRQAFGKRSPRPSIKERQSGDGSVEIYEIESVSSNETRSDARTNGHTNLSRTKSTSSDDIHVIPEKDSSTKSIEDLEDLEQLQNWRRTSKLRRSLQFPNQNKTTTNSKPVDLPENSVSVRKIREDLEKGRRLNTALRNNSVDLEALDQILQSISSSSSIHSDKTSDNADDAESESTNRKQKRNSFVTVESIQEVKGRLRRTSSPTSDIYKANGKEDDHDDGIVTEEISSKDMPVIEKPAAQSRVRSYVYGMEALLNKKPGLGTGSLESRVKLVNGNSPNRNEDWYNRRKSYGFEQMHNQEDSTNSMSFKNKNLVESSTDSGICRSTEIVLVPTATKTGTEIDEDDNISDNNSDLDQKYNGFESKHTTGKVKQMANTFTQDDNSSVYNKTTHEKPWDTFSSYKASDWSNPETELKSTTITIPIMKNNNIVDLSWNDEPEKDIKRHSIAVDESKYVTKNTNENKFRRTSLALNDQYVKNDEDDINPNRRPKKVEFCKTEVHFAAESGRVNIVATDEKPPPTQNFRRRRRIPPLLTEDFNKNGLPVLHFGDSSFEKTMFGIADDLTEAKPDNLTSIYENIPSTAPSTFGVVTVNTTNNTNNEYVEEDKKDLAENENIKGILKNKPIKPKPYHLGETVPFSEPNSDEDTKNWGVRLRHVEKEDTPIWKSTVTVHNYYEKQPRNDEDNQPEFQKLLKNLRPTRKSDYTSDNENRYSDSFSGIRVVSSSVKDNRRSSWSVADKIKTTEDGQSVENRGYSTKVNFGEGEATVVENDGFYDKDRHPTWPRMENSSKDSKQILNKGLVVRIGREDSASNHTVCSKMTTMQDTNNRTTTTKITIDLSPSPPAKSEGCFTYAKYQRSQNHSFKSTSLILSTIKDKGETKKTADIRTAERRDDRIPQQLEALKKLYEDVQSDSDADKEVQLLMSKITENDKMEDDDSSVVSGSWSKMRAYKKVTEHFGRTNVRHDLKLNTKSEKDTTERLNETSADRNNTAKYTNPNRSNFSPIALRKAIPVLNRPDLKSAVTTEKLSSPSLVGRNCNSYDYTEKLEPPNGRLSPSKEFKSSMDKKLQAKHVNDSIVLRQPKKSEMTYFGVNLSPKPVKKISQAVIRKENKLSDKPDLLQHYKKSPSPTRKTKIATGTGTKAKPRHKSPETAKDSTGPIYENLKEYKGRYSREFDSSILDELTKAADQILQAVNGYTDEDSHNRLSTDDEDTKRKNKRNEQLDTISETKSWKQQPAQAKSKPPNTKTKLKYTSSTSSVESVSHRRVTSSIERKPVAKSAPERPKKKTEKSESSVKANTKARRLQRASSREALLQSHGSSSEDLPATVEVPIRKPRLIKKTKAMQLTVSNGLEMRKAPSSMTSRRKEEPTVRSEERILGSLPEIRHKTAVSTIRSTADKATRERTRHRGEEVKKKTPPKREGIRGTNPSGRMEREKTKTSTLNKETVTHRISTANIKKCHRSDGGPRH